MSVNSRATGQKPYDACLGSFSRACKSGGRLRAGDLDPVGGLRVSSRRGGGEVNSGETLKASLDLLRFP
jgi:hypothetical protein